MSIPYRILFGFIVFSLAIPAYSQDANTKKTQTKTPVITTEEPRADGLKRITTRPARDWDFDIHIDEEALEANIERAVEQAMKEVDIALEKLEKLEIHIEPIEINLNKLNLDMKPINIHIPHLNIDIEPIMIDLDDMDIDIDEDFDHDVDMDIDADEDRDEDDDKFLHKNKNKENEELKNKSEKKDKPDTEKTDQKEKDKAKGLKKMN
jgi:hypothetical protein